MTWQNRAACAGVDPEVFYAESNVPGVNDATRYAEAARICASCPVRAMCLEEALLDETAAGLKHVHGFRGGVAPKQRARLIVTLRHNGTAKARCAKCGDAYPWTINTYHCPSCRAELSRAHDVEAPRRIGECVGCGRVMTIRSRGRCSTCRNHANQERAA